MNLIFNVMTNAASLNFIILTGISSQPCALLGLSDRMIFSIVSSEIALIFREQHVFKRGAFLLAHPVSLDC